MKKGQIIIQKYANYAVFNKTAIFFDVILYTLKYESRNKKNKSHHHWINFIINHPSFYWRYGYFTFNNIKE